MKPSQMNYCKKSQQEMEGSDIKTLFYCLAVGFIAGATGLLIILMTGR